MMAHSVEEQSVCALTHVQVDTHTNTNVFSVINQAFLSQTKFIANEIITADHSGHFVRHEPPSPA
jgi:hypothetical protein